MCTKQRDMSSQRPADYETEDHPLGFCCNWAVFPALSRAIRRVLDGQKDESVRFPKELVSGKAKLPGRFAQQALDLAREYHQASREVDTLIVRAESRLSVGEGEGLEEDLRAAIAVTKGNPKILGMQPSPHPSVCA